MHDIIIIRFSAVILMILFVRNPLFSQFDADTVDTDETTENVMSAGVDKISGTYIFTGNAALDINTGIGQFTLFQNYRGNTIQSANQSFTDDEMLKAEYKYPLSNDIDFLMRQNWQFYSSIVGENDNLERLNLSSGLKYNFFEKSYIELTAGAEQNKLLGIKSLGPLVYIDGYLESVSIMDLMLNSTLRSEYTKLNYGRENSDFDLRTQLFQIYSADRRFRLDLSYRAINKDFMTPGTDKMIDIESNLRDLFKSNISFDFLITQYVKSNFSLVFNNMLEEKFYKQSSSLSQTSRVQRSLHRMQLGFEWNSLFEGDNFMQYINISYLADDEENTVSEKFPINAQELREIALIEHKRDKSVGNTSLNLASFWRISAKDSLLLNTSVSIKRHDTPSELNNDDRDRLTAVIGAEYSHRFSRLLKARIIAETQMIHMVYLKAEKSAENNWFRSIRLKPAIEFQTKTVALSPEFEVLANYTVYDFEDPASKIRSISYRQISYRDSVFVLLEKNFSLQSRIIARYFENGSLLWNSFAEIPNSSKFEHFTNLLFFASAGKNVSIGCGLRFYQSQQHSLGSNQSKRLIFRQQSWAPETVIKAHFESGSTVAFHGWYEYQFINGADSRQIPNFFLLTTFYL